MGTHNRRVGRAGEDAAAERLVRDGLRIVQRNWRCRAGEIDIVAADGQTAVFVEVKTRTSGVAGHPFEAVTPDKLARLRRLAALWCSAHPEARPAALRVDVVAVLLASSGATAIEHIRGAA